jgi:UDP-2,3-diacylglucosamine pyrophosphatase LpxH
MMVFISDLHWGMGKDTAGNWDPTEDFRWPKALSGFLDFISARGADRVDLVIAGDLLELWQPPKSLACKSASLEVGCSVDEMKPIVSRVIAAHPQELAAVKAFSQKGENRVYIIPGNHDAALLVPEIWKPVAEALGADSGRVTLVESGTWASPDGKIVAEHGHQIGSDINRYEKWPEVTVVRGGQTFLVKSWGEHFVQSLFNDEERNAPIIDNLIPESAGARYRIAAKGTWQSAEEMIRFLAFDTFETAMIDRKASVSIPVQAMSGPAPPEISTADKAATSNTSNPNGVNQAKPADSATPAPTQPAAQAKETSLDTNKALQLGYRLFVQPLPATNPVRMFLASTLGMSKSGESPSELPSRLSSEDVKMLCTAVVERISSISCTRLLGTLLLSRTEVLRTHLLNKQKNYPNMSMFVYGHSHRSEDMWLVPLDQSRSVQVFNDGTFQRVIDEPGFLERARKFAHPYDGLSQIPLEDLPACYTALLIESVQGAPKAQLAVWNMPENGAGKLVPLGSPECR